MSRAEHCYMPQESGPCTNTEIRWFYDKTDGVCREFYYGGCLGNRNRFRTRKECEDSCSDAQGNLRSFLAMGTSMCCALVVQ